MSLSQLFTCRRLRGEKRWLVVPLIAVLIASTAGPGSVPLRAQAGPGAVGFVLDAGDLRFIFHQIEIAQAHVANPTAGLLGPGANQVPDARMPFGLRTVDGSFNHLGAGETLFGASDQDFKRLATPVFRAAEGGTSYAQKRGTVNDTQPRIISNLIVDQTDDNPAAVAVSGFGVDPEVVPEPLGTIPIPNVAPDTGLSAPFNSMFTFFGQFFDHGLDLVNKGSAGVVMVPLRTDDPLFVPGGTANFMLLTRATNRPGPDGISGDNPATPANESADDIQEHNNQTTPFVDQNQTYTSHPSHQAFLREYAPTAAGPVGTGKLIDGGGVVNGVPVNNIGNWAEVKLQARTVLGINLVDTDVFNVPMLVVDPYGRYVRGAGGFPIMLTTAGPVVGNPGAPVSTANALRTGHAFLDDIAHNAVPTSPTGAALAPDVDLVANSIFLPRPAGTYDNELLDAHFVTGDGRGNENIALTAVHTVFHAEHNRLADEIHGLINTPGFLTAAERTAWLTTDPASRWDYGERLFQAARFVTEMQYQHLVFEEFGRTLVPSINEFIGDGINFQVGNNPAITAEFAHQAYRLGHSMLTETIARTAPDGTLYDIPLLDGFLNPMEFNENANDQRVLTAAQAAGAIFQGGTRQVGNEIDEFVTEAVRNRLLGRPLDLAVLNLARGRDTGVPPLNEVRRQVYLATGDPALLPYIDWADFGFALKYGGASLENFIAAYGNHITLLGPDNIRGTADDPNIAGKRAAAAALVNDPAFMFGPAAATGVNNIDLWMGGLAEKIAPFGSMLGSTFNFIFEIQLENLQNADRFYYLERLDGLNLLSQMEGNSFAELISRNTTLTGPSASVFFRPDLVINLDSVLRVPGVLSDDPTTPDYDESADPELVLLPNGTIRYVGGAHVIWNGRNAGDLIVSSEGDDTLRGGAGNDRMEGGSGNDQPIGGDGDDILTDVFGEDVMKGGPGNDAINGGLGVFDLLQGNEDHDFIVGGNDVSEIFGGSGNDVIYTGDGATESFGGAGDDWLESGNQLNLIVGDENNQFQDDPSQGHDVMTGGSGDDDFDSEGGDDIMVGGVTGTDRLEGMLGFDWVTYRGDPLPVDADMAIRVVLPPNLDELRDRFDLVEALSGYNQNDILSGDDRGAVIDPGDDPDAVNEFSGHELTAEGSLRIRGLRALLLGATTFTNGNIIIGGAGSDQIEGGGGNDFIDGDAWLNVELVGTLNGGTIKRATTLDALRDDVFANPQRLNPGNIAIDRFIVPGTPGDDVDIAAFSGPRAEYAISVLPGGVVIVDHGTGADGRDTLRNIELLQFADGIIPTPSDDGQLTVPAVLGLQQADAEAAIVAAGLAFAVEIIENDAPAGTVLTQAPVALTRVAPGSTVSLQVSHGVELAPAPNLVGDARADATAEITAAGFILGTVTTANSTTIEPGRVISQNPGAGQPAALEGPINIVVSVGRPGLVLSLNFDEPNGAVFDASASARNGAITGATRVTNGKVGGALSFDGVNDWVTVLDGAAGTPLDLTNGMTLEAWVNPSTINGWETVIMKERGGANSQAMSYALYAADGAGAPPAGVVRVGTLDRTLRALSALTPGTWVHIATTYDGINQRMFINGVQVSTRAQAGNMAVGNQPLRIGGNNVFTGEFYNGLIDNVRIYNRALTAAELSAEITAAGGVGNPPPPPPPPPPGAAPVPVLSLNFDEASGNAIDSSASGLVGTVSGAVRVAGLRGNALSFDGVNDSVTIPDAAALDLTAGMTLAAWVNTGTRDGWETIILKENVDTYSYALYAQDGGLVQGGSVEPSGNVSVGGRAETLLGNAAIGGGTWVHLATTYDGTTQRVFVNGVEVSNAAVTGPIDTGAGNLRIGGNDVWTGEYYNGLIDEVRIYNRALTAAEINAIRNP